MSDPIIEEPESDAVMMSGSIFGGFYYSQLRELQRQTQRCPQDLPAMLDPQTGLAADAYLNAQWDPAAKHYMMHIVVRIRQLGTFERRMPNGGGMKWVTNLFITNDKLSQVQITAWQPNHKEIENLEIGKVCLSTICKTHRFLKPILNLGIKFLGIPPLQSACNPARKSNWRQCQLCAQLPHGINGSIGLYAPKGYYLQCADFRNRFGQQLSNDKFFKYFKNCFIRSLSVLPLIPIA